MKFSLYCCSPSPKPRGSRTLQKNDESTMVSIRSISQISLPQIQRKRKPWVYQDDYEFLKDQGRVYRLNDDDTSPYINRKQQAVKLIQQIDYSDPTDIEERFSFVLKYLKQTRIGNIYNLGVYAFAMVLQMNSLFEKSIAVWQKFLVFCNGNRAFKYKMIAYKYLTELYILEHDLKRALNYSKKLLKYALCFKEYEYELNAYELIGKIYYYQQEAQLAKAFHEKFMEGEQLSDNDQIRIQAKKLFDFRNKQQQSLGKIDTDSDEEFEITKLVEPKELSFNPVKLKDVLIKNKHLWGHVRKDSEPLGPINRSVLDKKLFQREYYTQLSYNNSLQKYMNNNTAIAGCKKNYIIIDKLIFDIQQF